MLMISTFIKKTVTTILRLLNIDKYIYDRNIKKSSAEYKKNEVLLSKSWKSSARIKEEMEMMKRYWRYPSQYQYIRYKLFDKDLTSEELLDYIPPFFIYARYNPSIYKNVEKRLFCDKLYLYEFLKGRGIRTPEVQIKVSGGKYFSIKENKPIEENELSEKLDDGLYYIKPIDGMGGEGIFTISLDNGLILYNKESINKLPIKHNRNYIIQKAINQRSDFSDINSSSVNTLRVITQNFNSNPKICACVMRIGRKGSCVDNSAQGGLSIKIDVTTGMMSDFAVGEHVEGVFYKHPDTGFVFKNFAIKDWDTIKSTLLDYVKKIPEIKEIAWDVAVVNNGIEIIEININYGIDHLQTSCGGMRRALSIYPN